MTLTITPTNAQAAYNNADAAGKALLENLLGKEIFIPKDIKEHIKSFDDVLNALDEQSRTNLGTFLAYNGVNDILVSSKAHAMLVAVAKVLNEGWQPDWENSSQYKYIPWFKHKPGFGLSFDVVVSWITGSTVGSRLCYKSEELAEYAATQFADLYNDFLTIK